MSLLPFLKVPQRDGSRKKDPPIEGSTGGWERELSARDEQWGPGLRQEPTGGGRAAGARRNKKIKAHEDTG